jgi:hypothetical protein
MHYLDHCLLTCNKFKLNNSQANKFIDIHKFIDGSKKHYWHVSHRALLHNTDYGQYLCLRKFGEYYKDTKIPTNELLFQHIRDDFETKIPRLRDWNNKLDVSSLLELKQYNRFLEKINNISSIEIKKYILKPFELTLDYASIAISCSQFGIEYFSDNPLEKLKYLFELENNDLLFDIKDYLKNITINEKWMNSPNKRKLQWLEKHK